jgi:hypothetical protein
MNDATPRDAAFHVSSGQHLLESLVCGSAPLWVQLGRLESDLLLERIESVAIEHPVYVSGLARSGTTILLELLASIEGVATHRYRDFPPVYTPFLWNRLLDRLPKKRFEPVERTHRDGIMITPDSPEAFEEVLWMTFFPWLHDPAVGNVLDERHENPRFEAFYRDHIRKLLLARGGTRYVAKGNYNVTRLRYIRKLLPDARFVLVVREPAGHIASLVKQHALFCEGESANPRALAHLRRVGHFEFGLDRRPINTNDDEATRTVIEMWESGDEVRAWARYWSQVYRYLADLIAADEALREAALVVRFEDLCRRPEATLSALLDHCRFERAEGLVAELAGRIRRSPNSESMFSSEELAVIRSETGEVAGHFGY